MNNYFNPRSDNTSRSSNEALLQAMLAGQYDSTPTHAMVASKTSATTAPRVSRYEPLTSNGALNKTAWKYGDQTYTLPPRAEVSSDRELKARIFQDVYSTLKTSTQGTWENKLHAFESHLQAHAAVKQAKNLVIAGVTPTSNQYTWRRRSYQDVAFNDAPIADPLPANVAYVVFDVTIDPRPYFTAAGARFADVTPPPTQRAGVMVQLIIDPATGNRDPAYTAAICAVFTDLYNAIDRQKPLIGVRVSDEDPFSTEGYTRWINKKYYQSVFEIAADQFRQTYVGEGIITQPAQRLQLLRQVTVNNRGLTTVNKVATHMEKFQAILQEIPDTERYPPLASTFFNSLSDKMRKTMSARGYTLRTAPRATNTAEYSGLMNCFHEAESAEQYIAEQVDTSSHVFSQLKGKHPSPGHAFLSSQAFLSPAEAAQGQLPSYGHDTPALFSPPHLQKQAHIPTDADPQLVNAFLTHFMREDTEYADLYDQAVDMTATAPAFISYAEKAMRDAANGQMKCAGCNSTTHLWRHCPEKHKPEIRAKANEFFSTRLGDRKRYQRTEARRPPASDLLTAVELTNDHANLELPSMRAAQTLLTIMQKSTGRKARKRAFQEFQQATALLSVPPPPTHGATPPTGRSPYAAGTAPSPGEAHYNTNAFFYIPAFDEETQQGLLPAATALLTANPRPFSIDLSAELPHVSIPIGTSSSHVAIRAAADSCAGMNIGELAFHRRIHELYPELVVNWVDLATAANPLSVGGVGKHSSGLIVSHVITYRLPYMKNGKETTLSIGLSKDAACTVLLGIGFFRKTRSIMSFSNPDKPVLIVNALNDAWAINMEKPSVRPPPVDRLSTRAFFLSGTAASFDAINSDRDDDDA